MNEYFVNESHYLLDIMYLYFFHARNNVILVNIHIIFKSTFTFKEIELKEIVSQYNVTCLIYIVIIFRHSFCIKNTLI